MAHSYVKLDKENRMRQLSIACAAMLVASAAAGQIFECVDAKGNKEFAQFCSPGTVKSTPLRDTPAATGSSDAAPASTAPTLSEQEIAFRKRELERKEAEAKAEKEKVEEEAAQRNCNIALSRLRALQDGQRINRFDPSTGDLYVVGDDTRAAEIAAAQKTADTWCKR